jgi:hypothetical protein
MCEVKILEQYYNIIRILTAVEGTYRMFYGERRMLPEAKLYIIGSTEILIFLVKTLTNL